MKQTSQKHGTYSVILVFKDPPKSKTISYIEIGLGDSLVVHWLDSMLPLQGPRVPSLVEELGPTSQMDKKKRNSSRKDVTSEEKNWKRKKNWKGVTKRDYTFLCLGIFNYLFLDNEPASVCA